MKVHQLIEELSKYEGEMEVVVDGVENCECCEGGTNTLNFVGVGYVNWETDWAGVGWRYCGDHSDMEDKPDNMQCPVRVLLLARREKE